jgi:hypothetical protein
MAAHVIFEPHTGTDLSSPRALVRQVVGHAAVAGFGAMFDPNWRPNEKLRAQLLDP